MRLTVLGGGGAFPTPARGCSGYLVEHEGFRLLVDPGYATLPVLLDLLDAAEVDAVFVTHSHADHCADLNPLLRVRHLAAQRPGPLDVFALPGAVDAVLALDADMVLTDDCALHEFTAGSVFDIGPFTMHTLGLSHFVDNVGVRIEVGDRVLTYSGDGGADPALTGLAEGCGALLAEATFPDEVPAASRGLLSSAARAAQHAVDAGAGRLVLTHLRADADPAAARRRAENSYRGPVDVAEPRLVLDID